MICHSNFFASFKIQIVGTYTAAIYEVSYLNISVFTSHISTSPLPQTVFFSYATKLMKCWVNSLLLFSKKNEMTITDEAWKRAKTNYAEKKGKN